MTVALTHTPAHILQVLLIELGVGTNPSLNGLWPIYIGNEPDEPDDVITIYNTSGLAGYRSAIDNIRQEYPGIQVRVRGSTNKEVGTRAHLIAATIDQQILRESVTIDGVSYCIHSVMRTGTVMDIGKETGVAKRSLFTINALITVETVLQ